MYQPLPDGRGSVSRNRAATVKERLVKRQFIPLQTFDELPARAHGAAVKIEEWTIATRRV